ncbi:septal ring lytic transglycosylase RlpA family protein [Acidobacteriota bacterium]
MKSHGKERYLILFLGLLLIASCTRIRYTEPTNVQTGSASWYGPNFHGKTTSNKEVYNMYDLTAAHRTLPFDTHVIVTNLNNGKSVTVRINDRGPFVEGRIIDLSYAAASIINAVESGVVPVKLEIIESESPPQGAQKFSVQAGSFVSKKNANALKNKIEKKYKEVYVTAFKTTNQTYYRVRIRAPNLDEAEKMARQLTSDGIPSYVIEL